MDCLSLFGSLIFALVFTATWMLHASSKPIEANGHSSQGACEAAQESAIRNNK